MLLSTNFNSKTISQFLFSTFGIGKVERIYRHCWKEHLEISKSAKFESRTLQDSENMVLQSRANLQSFECWGTKLPPSSETQGQ